MTEKNLNSEKMLSAFTDKKPVNLSENDQALYQVGDELFDLKEKPKFWSSKKEGCEIDNTKEYYFENLHSVNHYLCSLLNYGPNMNNKSFLDIYHNLQSCLLTVKENSTCENMNFLSEISVLFYKIRHEMFSSLYSIGEEIEMSFSTDADMTCFDSEMTPDLFITKKESHLLIEFSVTSSQLKSQLQKGGIGLEKYHELSKKIEDKTGKKVERFLYYYDTQTKLCNLQLNDKIRPLYAYFQSFCDSMKFLSGFNKPDTVVEFESLSKSYNKVMNYIMSKDLPKQLSSDSIHRVLSAPKGFKTSFFIERPQIENILRHTPHDRVVLLYRNNHITVTADSTGRKPSSIDLEDLASVVLKDLRIRINSKIPVSKFIPNYDSDIISTCYIRDYKPIRENTKILYPHELSFDTHSDVIPRFDRKEIEDICLKQIDSNMSKLDKITDYRVDKDNVSSGIADFKIMHESHDAGIHWVTSPFTYPLIDPTNMEFGDCDPHFFKTDLPNSFLSILVPTLRRKTRKKLQRSYQLRLSDIQSQRYKANSIPEIDTKREKIKELTLERNKILKEAEKNNAFETETLKTFVCTDKLKIERCYRHFNSKDEKSVRHGFNSFVDHKGFFEDLFTFFLRKTPQESRYDLEDIFEDLDDKDDVPVFKKLTNMSLDEAKKNLKSEVNKNYFHCIEFVTRLCYTLMYFSQTSHSGKNFIVDNLGYKNVVLIVRGGKKIFKTRRSRHFSLLVPTNDEIIKLYNPNLSTKTSINILTFSGIKYMSFPVRSLHEVEIQRGMSMYHSTLNYISVMKNRMLSDCGTCTNNLYFPILLMFNGKKKTEESLHNLRYPLANTIADFSALKKVVKNLFIPWKDHFQKSLNLLLCDNYIKYFNSLSSDSSEIVHPYTGIAGSGDIEFTNMIYSTYMMAKSPTDQTISQINCLKGMMDIHEEYHSKGSPDMDFLEHNDIYSDEKHFDSNFYYSKEISYMSGCVLGDYFKYNNLQSKLNEDWLSQLNKSWVNVANSSGLRYKEKMFFGRKGHFVVTNEILERTNKTNLSSFLSKQESKDTLFEKTKSLNSTDVSFSDMIAEKKEFNPTFHVVDKWQRGSDREIYVMDLETKTFQQPFEGFMAKMCKKIPCEMISVPSSKRLGKIHHKIFENPSNPNDIQMYATLDCTKWAPQSNINKYIWFLLGLSEVLPPSFIKYALGFLGRYGEKRIHITKRLENAFFNNKRFSGVKKYFKQEEHSGASFNMKYSFMMGIFNFLSSAMHAANIMLSNALIPKYLSMKSLCHVFEANIIAHSDDSAGEFRSPDKKSLIAGIDAYQCLLKLSNHNFSVKKCNISTRYFEFLSILYMDKRLLPMVCKFASNLEYDPSDNGPANDLFNLTSKTIEYVSMGATLSEACVKKRLMADYIFDFYKLNKNKDILPNFFGFPCSFPIMDMLAGSNSESLRLLIMSKNNLINQLMASSRFLLETEDEAKLPYAKVHMNYRVSEEIKTQQSSLSSFLAPLLAKIDECDPEGKGGLLRLLSSSNNNHFLTKLLMYNSLYKNKSYQTSLMYENKTRRISRAYHSVSVPSIRDEIEGDIYNCRQFQKIFLNTLNSVSSLGYTKNGKWEDMDEKKYNARYKSVSDHLDETFDTLFKMYRIFQKVDVDSLQVEMSGVSFKPCHFNFSNNESGLVLNCTPEQIMIQKFFPNFTYLTSPSKDPSFDIKTIGEKNLTVNQFQVYCQKFQKYNMKTFDIYSQVSSLNRLVDSPSTLLTYIRENFSYKKKIKKMISQTNKIFSRISDFDHTASDIFLQKVRAIHVLNSALPEKKFSAEIEGKTWNIDSMDVRINPIIDCVTKTIEAFRDVKEEPMFLGECDYEKINLFYIWERPQVRIGDKWVGNSTVLFKITDMVFRFTLEKGVLEKCEVYNPKFGFLADSIVYHLEMFFNFMRMSLNMRPISEGEMCLGKVSLDSSLSIDHPKNLITGVSLLNLDFDPMKLIFLSSKIYKRKGFLDESFVLKTKKGDKKIYLPIEMWAASDSVMDFIVSDRNLWMGKVLDDEKFVGLMDKLIKQNVLDFEYCRHDVLNDVLKTPLADNLDEIFPIEAEDEIDDFIEDGMIFSENIKKRFSSFCEKKMNKMMETSGYKDKLYDSMMKMNVDPNLLPDDLKKSYISECVKKYRTEEMDLYLDDLYQLLCNPGLDNLIRNFRSRWGNDGTSAGLELSGMKNLTMIPFDSTTDESYLQYSKKAFSVVVKYFSQLFKQHEYRFIKHLQRKGYKFSYRYKGDLFSTCCSLAANHNYQNNLRCRPMMLLIDIVSYVFDEPDLRLCMRNVLQKEDERDKNRLMVKGFDDPMLSIYDFSYKSKDNFLNWICSYFRSCRKKISSSDEMFKIDHLRDSETYAYQQFGNMCKNYDHVRHIDLLDKPKKGPLYFPYNKKYFTTIDHDSLTEEFYENLGLDEEWFKIEVSSAENYEDMEYFVEEGLKIRDKTFRIKWRSDKLYYLQTFDIKLYDAIHYAINDAYMLDTTEILDVCSLLNTSQCRVYNSLSNGKRDNHCFSYIYAFGDEKYFKFIEKKFKMSPINFKHLLKRNPFYLKYKGEFVYDLTEYRRFLLSMTSSPDVSTEYKQKVQNYLTLDNSDEKLLELLEIEKPMVVLRDIYSTIDDKFKNLKEYMCAKGTQHSDGLLIKWIKKMKGLSEDTDVMSSILKRVSASDVAYLLQNPVSEISEKDVFKSNMLLMPEEMRKNKRGFNIFGYNDPFYKTLETLLGGDKLSSISKGEIKLSSREFELIKAFSNIIDNNIEILNSKMDEKYPESDSYLLKTLCMINGCSTISSENHDEVFYQEMSGFMVKYTNERSSYLKKNYPRKKRPRQRKGKQSLLEFYNQKVNNWK